MARGLKIVILLIASLALFAAMIAADRLVDTPARGYDYVLRIQLPEVGDQVDLPRIDGPPDAGRPLVVIDAGHGGHDPGAGAGPLKEKMLTLQLAKALRDELLEGGGIRVALTREDDRYLLLSERSGIARRLRADLFVSVHADSVASSDARGASVYTLSQEGTSETAARIAASENRADVINGVRLADASDTVSAILVDLSQRETQARSTELARLMLREVQGAFRLHDDEVQSAAFVVLKSPDLPSVLFESGFISNSEDAALLASPEGRQAFAEASARAIRAYFARQAQL